jgi:hypothetical protein
VRRQRLGPRCAETSRSRFNNAAANASFSTTSIYLREADVLDPESFGTPFPPFVHCFRSDVSRTVSEPSPET